MSAINKFFLQTYGLTKISTGFFGFLILCFAPILAACQETELEETQRRLPPEAEEVRRAREMRMEQIPPSGYRFHPPVRIEAGDFPIQVEPPGYACPTMVDLDGDGRVDLVVGQMAGGYVQFFRNLAEPGEMPRFAAGQWLMKEGEKLRVPGISCCTSPTPQFVDWNQNGILDLISGNYSTARQPFGNIWLFSGKRSHTETIGWSWIDSRKLTDRDGQPLQTSTYAVDDDFQQAVLDGLCLHPHAVDYDNDGDLDLVVGTNGGRIFYFENQGTQTHPQFMAKPELLPIQLPIARSAPVLIDWDGDGDLDMITGASNGGIYLSINRGDRQEPIWSDWVELVPPPKAIDTESDSVTELEHFPPGHSTRVWVCDFNSDGLLDLIVGDCAAGYVPVDGVTIEAFWEKDRQFHKRRVELEIQQRSIYRQLKAIEEKHSEKDLVDPSVATSEQQLAIQLNETGDQLRKLWIDRESWSRPANVGHVWLYLQKLE